MDLITPTSQLHANYKAREQHQNCELNYYQSTKKGGLLVCQDTETIWMDPED